MKQDKAYDVRGLLLELWNVSITLSMCGGERVLQEKTPAYFPVSAKVALISSW